MTPQAPVVFLSYARPDREAVRNLYAKLSAAGFKPWMDMEDLYPGEAWRIKIRSAIREAWFFVACLSKHTLNRRGVLQRELQEALNARQELLPDDIYLIPARLEECKVPEPLRDFQWVDLFDEQGWSRLLSAIERGTRQRTVAPVSAGEQVQPSSLASSLSSALGETVRLTLEAPDGTRFETAVPDGLLVGQLLREFLQYWRPRSTTGKGFRSYWLSSDGATRLEPTATLMEAGLVGAARLMVGSDPLSAESAVGLVVEDLEGQRFTTAVRLDTPLRILAEAFLQGTPGSGPSVVELAAAPGRVHADVLRRLNLDSSLRDEGVGHDACLRIYRERPGA